MSMKTWAASSGVFTLGLALFVGVPTQAQCPEGKSEVVITTPRGMTKILCIPDQGIRGLENAADHSQGTVVPASCPCFDTATVDQALASNPDIACWLYEGVARGVEGTCTLINCEDSSQTLFLYALEGPGAADGCEFGGGPYQPVIITTVPNDCYPSDVVGISEAEGDACVAVLAQFANEVTCDPGFADCNNNPVDGCETSIDSEMNNCGACGNVCDTDTSDVCNTGICGCGSGPSCGAGQHCNGGVCICDATSCPTGCCEGDVCTDPPTESACGTSGMACVACEAGSACVEGVCCVDGVCCVEGVCSP